jgi:hypothetical protein
VKLHIRCFGVCEHAAEAEDVLSALAHHLELDIARTNVQPYWKTPGLWDIQMSGNGDFMTVVDRIAPRQQWSPLERDQTEPWAIWTSMSGLRSSAVEPRIAWIHVEGIGSEPQHVN